MIYHSRRLAVTVVVMLAVVFVTFLVTRAVLSVPENERAIHLICERGNDDLRLVNEKNAELIALFDLASAGRPAPDPEVLALYERYREPIPLTDCDTLTKEK